MLPAQRQAHILRRIQEEGGVRVVDLALDLDVSDMTVRRDLEVLADRGLIEKVHGGATLISPPAAHEPAFADKATRQQAEKAVIAEAAAAMVEPRTAIGLSAGTTTHAVAERLVDVPGLTVVTNSIWAADVLHHGGAEGQTVILTGGIRTPSDALVGPFAVTALRSVHLDVVFLGVHGMDVRAGFTTPNLLEAETDRALVESGRRLVVVADHTKWGAIGVSSIAGLDQANTLITDSNLDSAVQAVLEEQVGQLIVAEVPVLTEITAQ